MVKAPICDPGELLHLLSVEKNTVTRQDDGSWGSSWAEEATRRAKIEPLSGKELVDATALEADARHKVTLRYYSGLEPQNYRFKFGSRVLGIKSVQNLGECNEWMVCLCGEDA